MNVLSFGGCAVDFGAPRPNVCVGFTCAAVRSLSNVSKQYVVSPSTGAFFGVVNLGDRRLA